MRGRARVSLKSAQEIELIRAAARITAEIVEELVALVAPGVTTEDLDRHAEAACGRRGVTPAFKGLYDFPKCLCVAVNDVIVHGIPSANVTLRAGDIIGLDFGVVYRGWYGDHARTVAVGAIDGASSRLIATTERCLADGIAACQPGGLVRDIGLAVQRRAEAAGYSVVRDFAGHGIGRRLHEPPDVCNYDDGGGRMRLRPGMTLCIEPMVNEGTPEVRMRSDDWTAVTADGRRSAHFEHTIAITEGGPVVLSSVEC